MTSTTVLVLGATGRIGQLVVTQLLAAGGVSVRAIVRSPTKLPTSITQHAHAMLITADLTRMDQGQWAEAVKGCDAVVCCLGHVPSFKGLFGPPFTLVRDATRSVCEAIVANQPQHKVKLVELNTAGACNPNGADSAHRGLMERAFIAAMSTMLPPWRDSVLAAHYIHGLGQSHPHIEWCAVRPEWFKEGDVGEYALSAVANSLFAGGGITMANVAHFMCDLVTRPQVWEQWRGKMPCIRDVEAQPSKPANNS